MLDPYLGEVRLFAFNFAPVGWAPCQGQLLQISQNIALFRVLGTAYGGNGQNTFALPDYRDVAPAGLHYCVSLQGVFPQGPGASQTIGELATLPYSFVPEGWINCAGQLLSISDYDILFQLLGTRFGGDGEKTFGLPNLTATPPPPNPDAPEGGSLYFISAFGVFDPPGALLGTVQLQAFGAAPRGWAVCAC
jgi:microcystin-dependent protein